MVIESAHFLLNCFGLVRQDIASELPLRHPGLSSFLSTLFLLLAASYSLSLCTSIWVRRYPASRRSRANPRVLETRGTFVRKNLRTACWAVEHSIRQVAHLWMTALAGVATQYLGQSR